MCAVQICLWIGQPPQACQLHYFLACCEIGGRVKHALHNVGKEVDSASQAGASHRFPAKPFVVSLSN